MTLTLPPHLEAFVRERVESGRYADGAAVIDEALRLLEDHEKIERLRALIAEAEAEVARGELIAWTPDLFERLKREADEDNLNGVPIPDHVKP